MKYGENIIEIISKTNNVIDFKGIVIGTNVEIEYKDPNEFLTTNDYVLVEGNAYKSSENCIAMNENAKDSVITFSIYSSKETKADFYFNIASRSTPALISDILEINVNGNKYNTEASLPNVGQDFFTYNDVYLGEINLVKGVNEITFTVLTNDPSINTNMRSIIFKNIDAELSWAESSVVFNKFIYEAENTVINSIEYDGHNYPAISNGNNSSEEKYLGGINDAGLFATTHKATLTFKINANKSGKAKLYFGAGVSGSAKGSSYPVKVNNQEYISTQSWAGGWLV